MNRKEQEDANWKRVEQEIVSGNEEKHEGTNWNRGQQEDKLIWNRAEGEQQEWNIRRQTGNER